MCGITPAAGRHGKVSHLGRSVRQGGFTLVNAVVALVVAGVVLIGIAAAFSLHANILGQVADDATTFLPAANALYRIRDELKSAAQNPDGVTAAPVYAVSATSITFRSAEGYIELSDPSYPALKQAGLVSTNNIQYAGYAKTISYDANARTVTLTISGTAPAGAKTSEVLASDVVAFAFFDGESQSNPPAAPTVNSYVIGIRLVIRRRSTTTASGGADVNSDVGGEVLMTKVLIPPESLLNTKSKPVVGP